MTTQNKMFWKTFYSQPRVIRFYCSRWNTLELMKGGSRNFVSQCISQLGVRTKPGSLLDIGCGGGLFLSELAKAKVPGLTLYGVDISESMISAAACRLPERVKIMTADAEKMSFPDGLFDFVTVIAVLHEMPVGVRKNVMAECYRILKQDGKVLIVEHIFEHNNILDLMRNAIFYIISKEPERITIKELENSGLKKELEDSGFLVRNEKKLRGGFFKLIIATK